MLTNMDFLFSGLGDLFPIEFKSNLTVSKVWNTGETGDINTNSNLHKLDLGEDFYGDFL